MATRSFAISSSGFEYALKAANYVTCRDGRPEPDWDRFARDLVDLGSIADDLRLVHAMRDLYDLSPKKLVCENREVWFQRVDNEAPSNAATLRLLRRARNNLFHGQKFPWNQDRDEPLLQICLRILESIISLGPQCVRDSFR